MSDYYFGMDSPSDYGLDQNWLDGWDTPLDYGGANYNYDFNGGYDFSGLGDLFASNDYSPSYGVDPSLLDAGGSYSYGLPGGGATPDLGQFQADSTPNPFGTPGAGEPQQYVMPGMSPDGLSGPNGAAGGKSDAGLSMADRLKGGAGRMADDAMKNPLKSAIGLGSVGSLAAGLFRGQKEAQPPAGALAAMSRLNAARDAMSGGAEKRGYAGEETIRNITNQQIQDILNGKNEGVSPQTRHYWDTKQQEMRTRLGRELGPGWETSTPGMNAMQNFERLQGEAFDTEREQLLNSRNSMGMQRSQFANQLEMQPNQLDLGMMSAYAPFFQSDMFNADRYNRTSDSLMKLGGQGLGSLAGPALWAELYREARAGRGGANG